MLDQHLHHLRQTTQALLDSAQDPERAGPLLELRDRQLRALERDSHVERWTTAQLSTLQSLIDLGDQVRQPLVLRREMLRERVEQLRAARLAQNALKPFHEASGRRLNVKL